MPQRTPSRLSLARLVAIDLGVFLSANAFFATTTYVLVSRTNPQARWIDALTQYLPFWLLMAALAPLIFAITRRHRIGPGRGARPVLVHLGLALAWLSLFSLMWVLVDWLESPTFRAWPPR